MRSLATISSADAPSTLSSAYISRTLPRAIRGSSARVSVTWRDATERSGDRVQPRQDLGRVAEVVRVIEDRAQVQVAGPLVGGEQLAQRDALIPRALGQLLHDPVGLIARGPRLDERQQHALGEER